MPKKRHKAEENVAKLRQVDVLVSQGKSVAEVQASRFSPGRAEIEPSASRPKRRMTSRCSRLGIRDGNASMNGAPNSVALADVIEAPRKIARQYAFQKCLIMFPPFVDAVCSETSPR